MIKLRTKIVAPRAEMDSALRFTTYVLQKMQVCTLLFLFLLMGMMGSTGLVDQANAVEFDTDGVCAASASQDYYGTLLQYRKLTGSFIGDFINLSHCQLVDMLEVYERIDTVREGLQDAAYSCGSTAEYKSEYLELLLEVHFIRMLGPLSTGLNQKSSEADIEAHKESTIAEIEKKMQEDFVDEGQYLNEIRMEELVTEWSRKYGDKLVSYRLCSEGPWGEVASSWTDLQDTLQLISSASESLKDVSYEGSTNIENIWTLDGVETNEELQAVGRALKKTWDFLKIRRQEGLEKKESELLSLGDSIEAQGGTVDFTSYFDTRDDEVEAYAIEVSGADRMARYTLLYGDNGAQVASDLQGTVEVLNATLKTSNTHLSKIEELVKDVYKKQCN
jgi:hypothetical protein